MKRVLFLFAATLLGFGYLVNGQVSGGQTSKLDDHCAVPRTALLRSYNGHDHFYTTSVLEQQNAAIGGYVIEAQMGFIGTHGNSRCPSLVPLYRIYFPVSGDHFYTTGFNEMQNAVNNLAGKLEGITGYCMLQPGPGLIPLYRIYFPATPDHFYTTDFSEMQNAVNNLAGKLEGVACYVWQ